MGSGMWNVECGRPEVRLFDSSTGSPQAELKAGEVVASAFTLRAYGVT